MTKIVEAVVDGEVVDRIVDDITPTNTKARAVSTRARRAPAVQAPAQIDPMFIYQLSIEKNAPIEVIKQNYELVRMVMADNARVAFNAAVAAVRPQLPVIIKNRRVKFEARKPGAADTDYAYEDLAGISEQIDGILGEHGLSYSFETDQTMPGNGGTMLVHVTCVLSHSMGHEKRTKLFAAIDTSGNKNHVQAIGSAVTYLQRYTLKAALGLSATENDDDGRSAPDAPKPQVPRASASAGGNGNGAAQQQAAAPSGKPKPHAVPTAGLSFSKWALAYVELMKTADTLGELTAWDKLNDEPLTEMYNKARGTYDEVNAAFQKHKQTLEARAPKTHSGSAAISSGVAPPVDQPKSWGQPDHEKDYESFLGWVANKLMSWSEDTGDIEQFWNEVVEPVNDIFPHDKDELMSVYRKAEHRLGG